MPRNKLKIIESPNEYFDMVNLQRHKKLIKNKNVVSNFISKRLKTFISFYNLFKLLKGPK